MIMSLDTTGVVDAIGTEKDSDIVVLTIVDSWNWLDERAHLEALQAKFNTYFAFVESGEILGAYPNAAAKTMRIDVIFRHDPPPRAVAFLESAARVAAELRLTVRHRVHEDSDDSAPRK